MRLIEFLCPVELPIHLARDHITRSLSPCLPFPRSPCVVANWQLKNSCSWAALLHTSISKWYPDFGPTSLNPVCLWDFAHNLWLGHSFLWKALGTIFQRAPHLIFRWKFWTSYCESNLKAGLLAKQSVLPEASHMVCSIWGGEGGCAVEGNRRRKQKLWLSQKTKPCFYTKSYPFFLFHIALGRYH